MTLADALAAAQIVSVLVFAYIALRKVKPDEKVQKSTVDVNVSDAVDNLSSALGLTTKQLVENVANSALLQKRVQELEDQIEVDHETTRKRLEDTEKYREETTRHTKDLENKIAELNAHIEGMSREYVKETQKLSDENKSLRSQVVDLEKKYDGSKTVIVKMWQTLEANNIKVPDLNGDLSDSIKGWIWPTKPK